MVRYTLGPQDVDALAQQANPLRERATTKTRRAYASMSLVFIVLGLVLGLAHLGELAWAVYAYAAIMGALAVAADRLTLRQMRTQYRHLLNAGGFGYLLGDNAIEATPAGLRHFGPTGETLLYWSAIEEVVVTDDYLVIRFSRIGFYLVPLSAFPSATAAQAFVADLQAHRLAVPLPTVATPAASPTAVAPVAPAPPTGDWWRQGEAVVQDDTNIQRNGG